MSYIKIRHRNSGQHNNSYNKSGNIVYSMKADAIIIQTLIMDTSGYYKSGFPKVMGVGLS